MSNYPSKVGLGLPVYNGEGFLAEAIESVLAQSFGDFVLIISDNASTDRTAEISRDYESMDSRISYRRNDVNLGAAWNFNYVFRLSNAEYFKWVADDDLHRPEYLQQCVEILESSPDVVLCHSKVSIIDPAGEFVREDYRAPGSVNSPRVSVRFRDLISMRHECYHSFGLIRSDGLKRTGLIRPHVGSDRNLLVELGLIGRFYDVPEPLFLSRDHEKRSISAYSVEDRGTWFDPRLSNRVVLYRLDIFTHYVRSLHRIRIPWTERIRCYVHLARWLRYYARPVVKELSLGFPRRLGQWLFSLRGVLEKE